MVSASCYKNDKPIHPMDFIHKYRLLQWSDIPINTTMELEILAYSQCVFTQFKTRGFYIHYVAKALKNIEYEPENKKEFNRSIKLEQDEQIVIQFAYRSFINGMLILPKTMKDECSRDNMAQHDNLYMKFNKVSEKKILINEIKRVQGDTETMNMVIDMLKIIE